MLILLGGLACGLLAAREVTIAEAQLVATAWAARNAVFAGEAQGAQEPIAVRDADGAVLYYKVMLGARGMVIVSGDTDLDPVVAVLPEATSPELPEGHPLPALLAKDLTQRRAALVSSRVQTMSLTADFSETLARNQRRWEDLLGVTDGMQAFALNAFGAPARVYSYPKPWSTRQLTHWAQTSTNEYVSYSGNELYNFFLPFFANGTQVRNAGCVAIAGSAILQFFHVEEGPEGVSCTIKVNDSPRYDTKTMGGAYDWSLLPTWTRGVELSNDAKNLLGKVPYDVGCLVETNYTNDGSSAGENMLAAVLTERYGFMNASPKYTPSEANFATYIYPQVRAGAPVFLSINDGGDGGHAVLAVGYGEDDAGAPYTRVFMGWGGTGDAWYALPTISSADFIEGVTSYRVINSVTTGISRDENMVALCGRVTNDAGLGVPYETITVRYQKITEGTSETRTITTGLHGEYAARLPPATSYTLEVGGVTKTVSTTDFYPPATDIEVADAEGWMVYTDAQSAVEAAIHAGKPLFILSGPAWDEACTTIKQVLVALGSDFSERFVFCYNDTDYGPWSMNLGTPGYALYDPRTFVIAQGATGNTALAQDTACTEEAILRVLNTTWRYPAVTGLDIQGLAATLEKAEYSLHVMYEDGLSLVLPQVTWSVDGEGEITQEGALTITGTESVTVIADTFLHGEVQTVHYPVRRVDSSEVTGLQIHCADSTDGVTLNLEDIPYPAFTCTATLEDGSVHSILPEWSVSESIVGKLLPEISAEGVLNYAERNATGQLGHTLTITATFGTKSEDAAYTVHGYTSLWIIEDAWEITPRTAVPGGFVRITVKELGYSYGGQTLTTTDMSIADLRLIAKEDSAVTVIPNGTLEIAIPSDGVTKQYFLEACKKGGRNQTFSRTGEITIGVIPSSHGGALGPEMGSMPYEWLRPFFPNEYITEAMAKAKAVDNDDGDGYLNWEEYVLGTDPQDAESTLRLDIRILDDGTPEVTWDERPYRVYTLLGAASLDGEWGPKDANSRFFKVSVEIEQPQEE